MSAGSWKSDGGKLHDDAMPIVRSAVDVSRTNGMAGELKILRCRNGFMVETTSHGSAESRYVVTSLDELQGVVRKEFTPLEDVPADRSGSLASPSSNRADPDAF